MNLKGKVAVITGATGGIGRELVSELADKFKTIDILINAAGIGVYKPIEGVSLKDWNDSININVTSQFLFIKGLVKS